MNNHDPHCPLCHTDPALLLWRGLSLRVIEVDDGDYPGYTRVIWNSHITEMTHLPPHDRESLMRAVYAVETTQRQVLKPDKINLASLGNRVPRRSALSGDYLGKRTHSTRNRRGSSRAVAAIAAPLPCPPG
jgi:HIT domain